jgi:replicative DNA helicase
MNQEQNLPTNLEAEKIIITLLLNDFSLIPYTLSQLKNESFYDENYCIIFQTFRELFENNKSINYLTLIEKLKENNKLAKIGGVGTILLLSKRFEIRSQLEECIKIVQENYIRRTFIKFGEKCSTLGYSRKLDLETIYSKLENEFSQLIEEKNLRKLNSSAQIVKEIFQDMTSRKTDQNSGYESCYPDLDSILHGFQKADLIIIAGRPSMGKTAFSLNIAKNILEKYKVPMVIFSLEMSKQQIMYRFLSSDSKIAEERLKAKKMTIEQWKKLENSMKKIAAFPLYIEDSPNITIYDIRTKLQRIFSETKKTGIVIIDYLQLMKGSGRNDNRVQEISFLTRNLKLLAKEFNIPIFLLSQLSRNVESRVNKRPMLSDLRESGCIGNNVKINFSNSYSWNQLNIISQPSSFHFKGMKPTYFFKFENKKKIQITGNHKVLTKNGWKRISEFDKNTEILSFFEKDKFLKNQPKKVWTYEKVLNYKYLGIVSVYDQTVPVFHNYILENLIVHNSIEQDADIVIMIYREDYYNEKSPSSSQVTEFIVAKHRNGPIGSAQLLFSPSITTFSNIEK